MFTPAESIRILEAGSSRRTETADTRRRTRRQRRLAGRRAGRRAIGGSSGARRFGRHCRTRRGAGHRHAAPVRGLLLEAWPFRPSACAHRCRCARRAGHRRQSRRRLLAVNAICDVAGVLRHEHDVRGNADGRDHQRARGRSTAPTTPAASSLANWPMPCSCAATSSTLIRVGADAIAAVMKRGLIVRGGIPSKGTRSRMTTPRTNSQLPNHEAYRPHVHRSPGCVPLLRPDAGRRIGVSAGWRCRRCAARDGCRTSEASRGDRRGHRDNSVTLERTAPTLRTARGC